MENKRGLILKKYCSSGQKVHISLCNGLFCNGIIVEVNEEEELIIFNEDRNGEMFLDFDEIKFPITLFREKPTNGS